MLPDSGHHERQSIKLSRVSLCKNAVFLVADIKAMGKQELVLTASADKTARLWKTLEDGKYTCTAVLKDHSSDVTGVTPHVTSDYFVTASLDKTWCFYDTSTATCLQQVRPLSCLEVHQLWQAGL